MFANTKFEQKKCLQTLKNHKISVFKVKTVPLVLTSTPKYG